MGRTEASTYPLEKKGARGHILRMKNKERKDKT